MSGDVLLSHAVARAVPSALRGLASGFGMGPGVSLSLWSPKLYGDVGPTRLNEQTGTVPREPHSGRERLSARSRRKCVLWQALGLLVPVNSTPHRASIRGLSTPSSLGGLNHAKVVGDLILERASRLDAFSGYPFRT